MSDVHKSVKLGKKVGVIGVELENVESIELIRFPNKIRMGCCGCITEYEKAEDFPKENVACPCGAKGRWVVKYKAAE